LRSLTFKQKIAVAERWRPRPGHTAEASSRRALTSVARRWRSLDDEAKALKADIKLILDELAPQLLAHYGVGYDTASQLLIAAGDNPDRLANERSFAALCGSSPVEASSGRISRHRLNRGGDRQANSALWTVALVRMGSHPPTKAYVERRTADGLSKREIMRCLKRYIARELFPEIQAIVTPNLDQRAA
jgi:transposase